MPVPIVSGCERCARPAHLHCTVCGRTVCNRCLDEDERVCTDCAASDKRSLPASMGHPPSRKAHRPVAPQA